MPPFCRGSATVRPPDPSNRREDVVVPPSWFHAYLDLPSTCWTESVRFSSGLTGMALSPPRGESERTVTVIPAHGCAWVKLRSIDRPAPGVHLDLDSLDRATSVAHSIAAGATTPSTSQDVPSCARPAVCPDVTPSPARATSRTCTEAKLTWCSTRCASTSLRPPGTAASFWQHVTGRDLENGLGPSSPLNDRVDPAVPTNSTAATRCRRSRRVGPRRLRHQRQSPT